MNKIARAFKSLHMLVARSIGDHVLRFAKNKVAKLRHMYSTYSEELATHGQSIYTTHSTYN
jgi:hypothetical protein